MAEPWEDQSSWDQQSQDYMTDAEKSCEGQTVDESWEYQTDDYGYTTQDDRQSTGYSAARLEQIKRIQTALLRANFNPGTIDGKWGPKTCGAMESYQKTRWGTAKKRWLDVETWMGLGFDASTSRLFTDLYGMSCGGVPPAGWKGEGSGTNVTVTLADIQKIQYALGVLTTGVMDAATCKALYAKQRAMGITVSVLTAELFGKLGFTGTQAAKLGTQLRSSCSKYAPSSNTGGGGSVVVNPDKPKPKPEPPPKPVVPTIPPQKAGFGWWVLGGIVAVGMVGWLRQRGKKGGHR
jgi:hypothetical protein